MTPLARARGGGRPRRLEPRGISLAETLLAALLLLLLVVPLFGTFEWGERLFVRRNAAAALQQDLRAAVRIMVRELRMAGYDPSAIGRASAFETAGATSVRFIADVDGDGITDRVEYAYDPSARRITRESWRWQGTGWGRGTGPVAVAPHVERVAFEYYDASGTPTTVPARIRRVAVVITAARAVGGGAPEEYTVAAEARPRNL